MKLLISLILVFFITTDESWGGHSVDSSHLSFIISRCINMIPLNIITVNHHKNKNNLFGFVFVPAPRISSVNKVLLAQKLKGFIHIKNKKELLYYSAFDQVFLFLFCLNIRSTIPSFFFCKPFSFITPELLTYYGWVQRLTALA